MGTLTHTFSAITAMSLSQDESMLYSVAKNGCLKIFNMEERKQKRNIQLSKLTVSSCLLTPDEEAVLAGSWDNYM